MQSYLTSVFACCLRGRSGSLGHEGPDERTHLIPPASGEGPSQQQYVVDQQQLNARLGTIVRAKEGKMVSVNTPLPFNLHNRPIHDPSGSTTRSRSASAHLEQSASEGRVSLSPPRDASLSPSLPTSHSTSSLQPGDASYLPPEADPENSRRPVLNVRLIPTQPRNGIWTRRGRSATRGRYSRFGDDVSSARRDQNENKVCDGNGLGNGDAALETTADGTQCDKVENEVDESVADALTVRPPSPDTTPSDGECPSVEAGADGGDGQPASFHIQIADVGKISQSWGE